jgi:hypothetical protein
VGLTIGTKTERIENPKMRRQPRRRIGAGMDSSRAGQFRGGSLWISLSPSHILDRPMGLQKLFRRRSQPSSL